MTDRENLIYLAGIIDGEGTVSITKYNDTNSYSIRLNIPNTDKRLINWLQTNFKCAVYETRTGNVNNNRKWKDVSDWVCIGKNAYILLKQVRGFLLLKQEQTDLAIQLFEKVTKLEFRGRRRPPYIIQRQENLYEQCKKLNRRGKAEEND